jgi:hypothetical protein
MSLLRNRQSVSFGLKDNRSTTISKRKFLLHRESAGAIAYAVIVILLLLFARGSEALQFQDHRTGDKAMKDGFYHVDKDEPIWYRIASMPGRRMYHATVYSPCNDKIYVIGGSENYYGLPNAPENNCWEYDPLADAWTIKSSMPIKLNFICGVYCNEKIYVIGGYDSTNMAVTTNLIYDIVSDHWYQGCAFPSPSTAGASRVTWRDSLIFCFGGVITDRIGDERNDVYIYAPAQDTFYEASSLPFYMFYSGAAICFNDNLYIFGGATWPDWPLDSVVIGEIQSSQPDSIDWALLDTLPYPTYVNSAGLLDNKVYIVGGRVLTPNPLETNKVWEYDLLTGQYYEMPDHPMPLICGNEFVAVKPDSHWLYTMGGDTVFFEQHPHFGEGTASCFRLKIDGSYIAEDVSHEKIILHPSIHASPNPFRHTTRIRYSMRNPKLTIYDASGRMVKYFNLESSIQDQESSVVWHGDDNNGGEVPQGIYFIRVEYLASGDILCQKVLKVK